MAEDTTPISGSYDTKSVSTGAITTLVSGTGFKGNRALITISNSTTAGTNNPAVSIRIDGGTPTAAQNGGHQMRNGDVWYCRSRQEIENFKAVSCSGTTILNITYLISPTANG